MKETDDDLMRRYQAGDESALAELEQRYFGPLSSYFHRCRSSCNYCSANDLAREVFMKVFQSKSNFNPLNGRFKAWIYGIARNVNKDQLAEDYQTPEMIDLGDVEDQLVPGNVEDVMIRRIDVSNALSKLLPFKREVLWQHDVVGLTCPEIAQNMGANLELIKSCLRRARTDLSHLIFPKTQVAEVAEEQK